MDIRKLAAACVGFGVAAASPVHAGTLCDQLRRYERSSFDASAAPDGLADRWVELHWLGRWMDVEKGWGKKCVHSEDVESLALCDWLVQNSSSEFPQTLPFTILECYGYRFPRPYSGWSNWTSSIEILSRRWLVLDVDFSGWEAESGAIRLSVFRDEDGPRSGTPPLEPIPIEN